MPTSFFNTIWLGYGQRDAGTTDAGAGQGCPEVQKPSQHCTGGPGRRLAVGAGEGGGPRGRDQHHHRLRLLPGLPDQAWLPGGRRLDHLPHPPQDIQHPDGGLQVSQWVNIIVDINVLLPRTLKDGEHTVHPNFRDTQSLQDRQVTLYKAREQ